MFRLSRRDYSIADLRRSLLRAGHANDAIAEAIERLSAQRALDDERYAAGFARTRLAYHGVGRNRIRMALRQKGVDRATVEKGLAEALAVRPESEAIEAAARRLIRQYSREEPRKRLAKIFAALLRRGFPVSMVRERLAVLQPGCRDMLEDYGVAAAEMDSDPFRDAD